MTNILFVCSANVDRSPTAERIYSGHPELAVKSAGVSPHATTWISAALVEWADIILCMEKWQRKTIEIEFSSHIGQRVIDYLDVPDSYRFMNEKLVRIIREKVDAWLEEY
ncbi:MAG TPA: phosphotyrosine protein phosphatase [Desulfobulbaceae bacterium]|nr:phosphotyrosine protein phosphatase [Desulfobulbaceae bacterium]